MGGNLIATVTFTSSSGSQDLRTLQWKGDGVVVPHLQEGIHGKGLRNGGVHQNDFWRGLGVINHFKMFGLFLFIYRVILLTASSLKCLRVGGWGAVKRFTLYNPFFRFYCHLRGYLSGYFAAPGIRTGLSYLVEPYVRLSIWALCQITYFGLLSGKLIKEWTESCASWMSYFSPSSCGNPKDRSLLPQIIHYLVFEINSASPQKGVWLFALTAPGSPRGLFQNCAQGNICHTILFTVWWLLVPGKLWGTGI